MSRRIDAASVVPTAVFPELAAWSLALERADAGAGVGRMEVASTSGGASGSAQAAIEALALREVDVRVRTEGDLAVTEVEHVFHNPADGRPREGTFRFPVPDGAPRPAPPSSATTASGRPGRDVGAAPGGCARRLRPEAAKQAATSRRWSRGSPSPRH